MATEHKYKIIKLLKEDTDCSYKDCEIAYYKAVEYLRGFGGIKAKIEEQVQKMNNDMIPVGTTVHINPEDIKWNGGDLISREDLKEHAQKLLVGESINTYFGINLYKMFEEIIDHTPAVGAVQMDLHEKILDQTIRELFKCQEELEKVRNGERSQDEWVRKVDVIQSIAKQYSEHDELVPMWLSIGDIKAVRND